MADIPEKDVKAGLARIQGALANPRAKAMIEAVVPAMAKAYLTHERITKIVLTAASRMPKLAICTPASILKEVMEYAPLGLEIGGPRGHVYLVPFWSNRIGAFEAVGIPGYKGYIELAFRTDKVESICADVIREGDVFKHVRHADKDEFMHEKAGGPDADITGFYMRAIYKDGGGHIEHMWVDDVEKHRQRSRAKDAGPWITDYIPMGKKTTVRVAQPYLPQSWEMAALAEIDRRIDTGDYIDASRVIDAVPIEVERPQTATDALADRIEGQLESGNEPPDDDAPPMPPDPEEPEVQAPPAEVPQGNGAASGRKAKTYTHTGKDAEHVEFIERYLLDSALGDTAKAMEYLVELTTFKGDNGMVKGVDSFEKISPKQLNVLYGQVQALIKKSGKGKPKDNDEPFA